MIRWSEKRLCGNQEQKCPRITSLIDQRYTENECNELVVAMKTNLLCVYTCYRDSTLLGGQYVARCHSFNKHTLAFDASTNSHFHLCLFSIYWAENGHCALRNMGRAAIRAHSLALSKLCRPTNRPPDQNEN